jgi:hypothetical protein
LSVAASVKTSKSLNCFVFLFLLFGLRFSWYIPSTYFYQCLLTELAMERIRLVKITAKYRQKNPLMFPFVFVDFLVVIEEQNWKKYIIKKNKKKYSSWPGPATIRTTFFSSTFTQINQVLFYSWNITNNETIKLVTK